MDTCGKASWTMEDICTLVEETEDFQNFICGDFKESMGRYIPDTLMGRDWRNCPFIDWENKECDFLQESFYQILRLSREYEEGDRAEREEVKQWLKEGKVLAEQAFYYDFSSYLRKHQELDFDYNEIGFPTNSVNGNYLDSEGVLVVRKGVSDKGAATAFLEQLLSEEVQKKLYFISVRKLERETFTDENGIVNLIEGKGRSITLPIKEGGKTYIEEFQNFLLKCAPAPINDSILDEIICAETFEYTTGNRSLEETVEILQKRVHLYLEEAKLSNK